MNFEYSLSFKTLIIDNDIMIMHRDDGKYLRQDFSGSSYSTNPRDTHSVDFICEIHIIHIMIHIQ